jgi:outer membrane murein-binding lipoprotein Lpp
MNRLSIASVVVVIIATALSSGCSSPNAASIKVRRENQDLRNKVAELERRERAHLAQIRAMESKATTVPSLPNERIETLFTAHGLRFGRLTGGADLDPKQPGDDGLKIYVVPTDGQGQPIKAAGSFVVEAFDLAKGDHARVGHWEYPLDQAAKNWFGQAMLYTYVLPAPWQQQRPEHSELTIRVTFTDALTGRSFTEQKVVKANLAR